MQALAFTSAGAASLPEELRDQPVVQHLATLLRDAPKPMQCAAAGTLCNLALGLEEAQVCRIILLDAPQDLTYNVSEWSSHSSYATS